MRKSDINPMPAFFDRYINLAEDLDILEALEKYAPENVYDETEKLVEMGDRVYAPGKWTVKDILQHVIDNERIMSYRALRFSRNDKTTLPGYDEEILAAHTMASKRTVQDLMDEFGLVRATSIALFKNMDEKMILSSGVAYKSEISALALGFVIVGHAVHHMNVIRERYFPLLQGDRPTLEIRKCVRI
ncbi:hypothetical protein DYBT9275_01574 [Dyadobacter sp. CECT 9275]|uniref:DinB-like domain-containing protein n=1 Tax=Dyadobacter helix TaxID=2822344 RepID=A0A916NKL2_9BACT|nr:DinB family protein [Dyadobacter sp. CECT 9275]CAG4995201.1 hypothetical protein DYBT9275_01574 [Dyadobacter sp. CECT 9275]